ncbi:MAG: glycosyltransferase family 4 protein [Deltaproteobacteria bacterium]|nr:glycosyltransferase family 4 protein [Deltaproteobacteria bacterium]
MLPEQTRLCFVAYRGNMNCGGQGVYLWFLSRELARLGFEIDVFVGPPYPDPMPFAERVHRIENQEFWAKWFMRDYAGMLPRDNPLGAFKPLNLYELAASRIGFLPEPFAFSLRAFRSISARLRAGQRWDLIHDVQCLGYGLLGLRALGIPVVTTVHHPLTVDRRASFIRDTNFTEAIGSMQFYPIGMQSFVARHIDRVLTSSESSARQIAQDFRVAPSRIANVWNGLDTDLYSPDPAVPKSESEVLCVGRASDPNKGIRSLIEALAHTPEHVTLTLVDNDHPDNEVFKWARAAGVADRLSVTGRLPVDELIEHYRRAALVAVPSRYEGFGLPAVEAMACGTPVVACAAGALREVMQRAGGGITVPIDDAEALGAGITQLIGQPERRRSLAETGRARVEANFSWQRIAGRTAEVYAEVLAERRGRPTTIMTSASTGAKRASASRA